MWGHIGVSLFVESATCIHLFGRLSKIMAVLGSTEKCGPECLGYTEKAQIFESHPTMWGFFHRLQRAVGGSFELLKYKLRSIYWSSESRRDDLGLGSRFVAPLS